MKENFLLYLQPIPLDRFIIIDAEATHAGMLLKRLTRNNKGMKYCEEKEFVKFQIVKNSWVLNMLNIIIWYSCTREFMRTYKQQRQFMRYPESVLILLTIKCLLNNPNGIFDVFYLGSTLKNSFIIIHYSRFKQTVGLYTLQAPSQNLKVTFYGQVLWSKILVVIKHPPL